MTEKEKLVKAKIPGEDSGIQVCHTFCDICTGIHCGLDVYVKDDTVVKVEGTKGYPINDGKLCTKGASNRQYLYRKNRITSPLRRTGPRGSGMFEEISWEEAYDEIAKRLSDIREEHGPESVAWFAGYTKWFRPWLHRMAHTFGSLNYGTEASTCHKATVMAWKTVAGRLFYADIAHNNELYIGWGCNVMVNEYTTARALQDFKDRGGKLVIIDTRDTMTSQKMADMHVKIHPGTDGALAWGLAHIMIERGWYDKEFVEKYAYGFEEYRAYAKEYTPEKTSQITGVPVEQIVELADLYGHAKQVCNYSPSAAIAHNTNGYNSERAIFCLQVITGNIDKPGTQLPTYPGWVSSNCGFKTREHEFVNGGRPTDCKPRIGHGKFPVWDALIDEFQIAALPEQIETGKPYPIKAVMAFGMNHSIGTDPNRVLRALDKLDFLVATDVIMTETCKHADIVLPVCTSLERTELKAYGGGYLKCTEPCVTPLYGSKPDAEIICELAKRLNPEDTILSAGYEATLEYMIGDLSVDLEQMRKADLPVKVPEYQAYVPGTLLKDGFETPSGKLELWSNVIAQVRGDREDLNPLPVWQPGGNVTPVDTEKYPMTLISGSRIPNAIHSRMHEEMPWPRTVREYASADIHPEDAARLGIKDGDKISLSTENGSIQVRAHLTAAGSPGDVYMFHGYREANVNTLIAHTHLDPYSGFPGFNQMSCAVERVEEG